MMNNVTPPGAGFVCDVCNHRWYYSRACCPNCGGRDHTTYPLGTGQLVATTSVNVTPDDVREPNHLGLAAFDHGVCVIAQIAEAYDPAIDDPVMLSGEYVLRGHPDNPVTGPRLVPAPTDD